MERLKVSSSSCSEGLTAASEALVCVERNDLEADVEGDFSTASESGAEVTDGEDRLSVVQIINEEILLGIELFCITIVG